MKRPRWIVGVAFLITAIVLVHTGWLGSATSAPAPTTPVNTAEHDPLHTPAGWSYRHHQPTHWRASMLRQ